MSKWELSGFWRGCWPWLQGPSRGYVWHMCVLIAALKGLSYWIVFKWIHPDATLEDLLFFRRNDIEYVQFVGPLASGDVHFKMEKEGVAGIFALPLGQFLPYVLGYAVLGVPGIILTDIAVSVATLLLFVAFLETAGARRQLALVVATVLLVLEITLTKYLRWHVGFGYELATFWDLRFPKPFLSFPMVLGCLLWLRWLISANGRLGIGGLLTGAFLFAWLQQTDVFRGLAVSLLALAIGVWLLISLRGKARLDFLGRALLMVTVYAILMLPFFMQREVHSNDAMERLGFATVHGLDKAFLQLKDLGLGTAAFLIFAAVFVAAKFRRSAAMPQITWLTLGYAICAWLAMPVLILLTRQIAQPFHFQDGFDSAASLLALSSMVYLIARVRMDFGALGRLVNIGLLLAALVVTFLIPYFDGLRRQVQVGTYRSLAELTNYRADAIELRRWLRQEGFDAGQVVVGTLDPHVAFYSIFKGNYLLVPDAGPTDISDREQLSRFLYFCAVLNLSTADVESLLWREDVHLFWVTHIKFNIDRFNPPVLGAHYRDQDAWRLDRDTLDFNVAIPKGFVEAAVKQYSEDFDGNAGNTGKFQLDLIVLPKTSDLENAQPDSKRWALAYQNASFRAWKKSN